MSHCFSLQLPDLKMLSVLFCLFINQLDPWLTCHRKTMYFMQKQKQKNCAKSLSTIWKLIESLCFWWSLHPIKMVWKGFWARIPFSNADSLFYEVSKGCKDNEILSKKKLYCLTILWSENPMNCQKCEVLVRPNTVLLPLWVPLLSVQVDVTVFYQFFVGGGCWPAAPFLQGRVLCTGSLSHHAALRLYPPHLSWEYHSNHGIPYPPSLLTAPSNALFYPCFLRPPGPGQHLHQDTVHLFSLLTPSPPILPIYT